MVEGTSGILAISPDPRPLYEPSKRRLTWPNGAVATTYSADEPERLRGPQHDAAWCDEFAAWRYPEAWDMLMFGMRLGGDPHVVVTTTPKPTKIIRDLLDDPAIIITRGTTYDNATNLTPAFLAQIVKRYEGTRLGRQELNAEVLEDVPGALWNRKRLEELRWPHDKAVPELVRIVVAIDPAASFDRKTAGFSPDRVDALVWAFTDLLVEPMSNEGIYDLYRQRAAKAAAEKAERERKPESPPQPGSMQWFEMMRKRQAAQSTE